MLQRLSKLGRWHCKSRGGLPGKICRAPKVSKYDDDDSDDVKRPLHFIGNFLCLQLLDNDDDDDYDNDDDNDGNDDNADDNDDNDNIFRWNHQFLLQWRRSSSSARSSRPSSKSSLDCDFTWNE